MNSIQAGKGLAWPCVLSWSGRRRRLAKFIIQRWGLHRKEGLAQRMADLDGVSLIDRGRVRALRLTKLIGSDSPSGNQPNPTHPIPINNLEVWLSGLRHWFAKSTYKKIVSWVRIPFPPARKWNGRAKWRERKNLLVESLGGQNSTT